MPEGPRPGPRQLEEERAWLLREIEELDREHRSGDVDDQSYAKLRDGYVARAASVLRSIEAAPEPLEQAGPEEVPRSDRAGGPAAASEDPPGADVVEPGPLLGRRAVAAGALALAVLVGLCVLAVSGGGTAPAGSRSAAAATPGSQSVAAELYRARTLANQGKEVQALQGFQQVLSVQPRNAEALAYQGWLLYQAGSSSANPTLVSDGRASIEAALSADPGYPDAHAFMGYVLFYSDHNPAGAVAQFRAFLADKPPTQLVERTRSVVSAAFAAAGQPVPAGAG